MAEVPSFHSYVLPPVPVSEILVLEQLSSVEFVLLVIAAVGRVFTVMVRLAVVPQKPVDGVKV